MAAGVDELDYYQGISIRTRPRRVLPQHTSYALPPPGALEFQPQPWQYKVNPRRRRIRVPLPAPTFFGPPYVPTPILWVHPSSGSRGRQRTRFNYFPEYPVPTLYRPCELEVLQLPTNPYARLARSQYKAIIYMRESFKGDPEC